MPDGTVSPVVPSQEEVNDAGLMPCRPDPDFVTVITTIDGALLTKEAYRTDTGAIALKDYDNAYLYDMKTVPVGSLQELAAVLDGIDPHSCIVNGRVRAGIEPHGVRRTHVGENATLEEAPHYWLPLDLDGVPAVDERGEFDPVADPERAVRYVVSLLPAEFQDNDCHWRLSSGAGISGDGIRLRLFFWLSRPMGGAEIKEWLADYIKEYASKKLKTGTERRIIDGAIYTPSQPIYVGAPIFPPEIADPVPRRSGISLCLGPVEVPASLPPARNRKRKLRAAKAPETAAVSDGGPAHVEYDEAATIEWGRGMIRDDLKQHGLPDIGGGSDPRTYRIINTLKDGPRWGKSLTDAAIVELLREHWQPDFDRDWYEAKTASATYPSGSRQNPDGVGQAGSGERKFGAAVEVPPIEPQREAPAQQNPRINLLGLDALMALPDPVDLVEKMIVDREVVAIVGPPKAGKSFLALEIALSVATGQAAQAVGGRNAVLRPGPVIYLSGEGHAGMKSRVLSWCRAHGVSESEFATLPFFYNRGVPIAAEGEKECKAFIEAIKSSVGDPVLVIIDTMARSLGGLDENAAASATLYLDLTEGLRAGLDCTTLTVAHASNKPNAPLDFRGTSAFSAGFDSVWTLDKCDQNGTVEFRGKWFKEHEIDERGPYYFRLRKDGDAVTLTPAQPPTPKETRDHRFNSLKITMAVFGMRGWRNALTDQEFAERRAGDKPEYDPALSDEDNGEAYSQWAAAVERNLKDLERGARSKGEDRPAIYEGLFQPGVKLAEAMVQVGRRLEIVQPGKRKATTVRLWFLPGHDDER